MNGVMKKMKLFIVITLVALLAGMTMLGIFGFNNAVDYRGSYEVLVKATQNVEKSKEILKSSADKYMSDNGIKASSYAFQQMDDGSVLVYKFDYDVTEDVQGLATAINAAFTAESLDVTAEVEVNQVKGTNSLPAWQFVLALGIAVAVIFLYMLIMEKLASSVAVVCSSVLGFLLFVALTGLTRLPAVSFAGVGAAFATALSAILSASTVGKYKEEIKNSASSKISVYEIAEKVAKNEKKKYIFILGLVLVAAVALCALFTPYLMIVAGHLALAGVCSAFSAYFTTPLIWTAIKKNKKS